MLSMGISQVERDLERSGEIWRDLERERKKGTNNLRDDSCYQTLTGHKSVRAPNGSGCNFQFERYLCCDLCCFCAICQYMVTGL